MHVHREVRWDADDEDILGFADRIMALASECWGWVDINTDRSAVHQEHAEAASSQLVTFAEHVLLEQFPQLQGGSVVMDSLMDRMERGDGTLGDCLADRIFGA